MSGDNIETRTVINFVFLQGKTPKEINTILTETIGEYAPCHRQELGGPV